MTDYITYMTEYIILYDKTNYITLYDTLHSPP